MVCSAVSVQHCDYHYPPQGLSLQFYSSLRFGLSVKKSFEQAKGIMMIGFPTEENTPMLYVKDDVDADTLFIVRPFT